MWPPKNVFNLFHRALFFVWSKENQNSVLYESVEISVPEFSGILLGFSTNQHFRGCTYTPLHPQLLHHCLHRWTKCCCFYFLYQHLFSSVNTYRCKWWWKKHKIVLHVTPGSLQYVGCLATERNYSHGLSFCMTLVWRHINEHTTEQSVNKVDLNQTSTYKL